MCPYINSFKAKGHSWSMHATCKYRAIGSQKTKVKKLSLFQFVLILELNVNHYLNNTGLALTYIGTRTMIIIHSTPGYL